MKNPWEVLKELLDRHPTLGGVLLTGVACFAAVALVARLGIDPESRVASVAYVAGVGLIFFLLVGFLTTPRVAKIAGGFIAALIVVWGAVTVWARLDPSAGRIKCGVEIWRTCETITYEDFRQKTPKDLGSPPAADTKRYNVTITFAGSLDRTHVVALADALREDGWNIQRTNQRGGVDRDPGAAGKAVVRYNDPSAQPTAKALAAALNASKITPKPVAAVEDKSVGKDALAVLISN